MASTLTGNSDVDRSILLAVPYDMIGTLSYANTGVASDDRFWRDKWVLDFHGTTTFKQLYFNAVKEIQDKKDVAKQFGHAAKHGWRRVAQQILDTTLSTSDEYTRNNHLIGATIAGWIDMAEEIINNGADVNSYECLALYKAVQNEDLNMAQLLVKRGANPHYLTLKRHRDWLQEKGLYELSDKIDGVPSEEKE